MIVEDFIRYLPYLLNYLTSMLVIILLSPFIIPFIVYDYYKYQILPPFPRLPGWHETLKRPTTNKKSLDKAAPKVLFSDILKRNQKRAIQKSQETKKNGSGVGNSDKTQTIKAQDDKKTVRNTRDEILEKEKPSQAHSGLTIPKFQEANTDCAICLEPFSETDPKTGKSVYVRELGCWHMFHDKCVVEWLTKYKRVCPVCQFPLGAPVDEVV